MKTLLAYESRWNLANLIDDVEIWVYNLFIESFENTFVAGLNDTCIHSTKKPSKLLIKLMTISVAVFCVYIAKV